MLISWKPIPRCIGSVLDATLNLSIKIHDILFVDITQGYESIPLKGQDNLLDAVSFIARTAFRHSSKLHPHATTSMWVHIDITRVLAAANGQQLNHPMLIGFAWILINWYNFTNG